ncbi:MAG: DUF6339 family protein [Prevotella sp.]|nr:DUF6339 family protein [Prevotella sp.]
MELQKTFKESFVKELKDKVKAGNAFSLYKEDVFEYDHSQEKRLANVYAPANLKDKIDLYADNEHDYEAAKTLFEAYKDISPLLASNEAFWVYLTHTTMFNYVQHRWPKVFEDKVSVNYILDHWFVGGQGILRNAAATLWWYVHNTVDETRDNKYELTEILFKNYTFRSVTFGTSFLIRHREAMIGILDFLLNSPEITDKYFENRGRFIAKYFNRLGAVKQLTYFDRDFFRQKCEIMKDKILSVTTREQLENDELYVD